MKRKINKIMLIFSIINFICTILFLVFCFKINVIPIKYMIIIIAFFLLLNFISFILLKKKRLRIIGVIISIMIIIISVIGAYYLYKTDAFLGKAFTNVEHYYNTTYYVIKLKNSEKDVSDLKIGYYDNSPSIVEALIKVKSELNATDISYQNLYDLFLDLEKEKIGAILIEKSLYNFILESDSSLDMNKFKIVSTFDINIKEEIEEISSDGNSFSIYIGGTDFTELYTDFNMIVTVNKKTHTILLTSTPRDFYVPIYNKGGKDLLGYAGVWGINTSRKTLENLYDIDMDYFVKINTKSLVGLVDTLGGVEFCSNISFTTTHATVIGTYDDTTGSKLQVTKGCRNYSGIEILTIARERKAYPDGDRQRQKNCQEIMISIFNKIASTELIKNYSNILNAVSDLYTTNIPKDLITDLVKDTINNTSWKIEQQSVTGRDSNGYVHFSNFKDYVMIPNEDSVNAASMKIKTVVAGK